MKDIFNLSGLTQNGHKTTRYGIQQGAKSAYVGSFA